MPLRKKSKLSRSSKQAVSNRRARSQESAEERDARLSANRERQALSQVSETATQRELRLRDQRIRTRALRSIENSLDYEASLHRDREYHSAKRASETCIQREERLNTQRRRKTAFRNQENEEERKARLDADREQHALSRASETFTQREERLNCQRSRMSTTRSQENDDEREARLNEDRERHAESRASETYTQREERLTCQRSRTSNMRSQENDDEREARLNEDRERHAESRASETYTQREERLTCQRSRTSNMRSQENDDEREARLNEDRERHAESRASETYTQREERLTCQRSRTSNMRSQENDDEREARLNEDRERHAESRASETYTQREERLTCQRSRTSNMRSQENDEQMELRLAADRDRHNQFRSTEPIEERERRLLAAREDYRYTRSEIIAHASQARERIEELRFSESAEQRNERMEADRVRQAIYRLSPASGDSLVYEPEEQPWLRKEGSGFNYEPLIKYAEEVNIGQMTEVCQFCTALKFKNENPSMCCSKGKIYLEPIMEPPEPLKSLLNGSHPLSKHFLDNIRVYNSAFQMTSFGAKQTPEPGFMPTFRIQGQVYHRIGALLPTESPKFLQIYFIEDYIQQANIRQQYFQNLHPDLVMGLQNMLHDVNHFVNSFKTALQSVQEGQNENYKFVINADRRPAAAHAGRYNAPTTNEVAVVLVDQDCDRRDIVLRTHDDRLQRISETHRAYDALQYPLMFCRGEDGYNFALRQVNPSTGEIVINKKATAMQFYCYRMQVRQNIFTHLQRFRGVFSQFIVDMYAKIETERLVWIRTHQKQLRAENYVDLRDAVRQDTDTENMGRLVILPSSFTGGPRDMHQHVQDALSYVRKYGKPDLFITATTNPKWTEITQELLPGQVPFDRHDLISRVFHLKLKLLINLLTTEKVFGTSLCYTYNIEWQKRGLPHAHILLWLQEKIRPQDVDKVIRAEIPDPEVDPDLRTIVMSHMIHGPCGALNNNSPCMRDGRCTKKYPRPLSEHTITGEDGYPKYRRRAPEQGGQTANLRLFGQDVEIDNRWVVPYSPVLSRTFQGHINAELCSSIKSIQYVFKYVNKGSDQATLTTTNDRDEVTRFQTGRYISSSEAAWRIFHFPIYGHYPPVMHLDVHVEGGQRVYFNQNNLMERLENPRQTTLTAFFNLCESDDFAKTLLYNEVPQYYTYKNGMFNRRIRGDVPSSMVGRVYTVHPNNAECFYARLLLHTVRGPTSFATLKTYNDIEYPNFQAACRARGLLEDDQHWDNALSEASLGNSPQQLRRLFAVMLVFCSLSDANQLWVKYQNDFAGDFLNPRNEQEPSDAIRTNYLNRCLSDIQDKVISIGGHPLAHYGLPEPDTHGSLGNREHTEERNYNTEELASILEGGIVSLTCEQKSIFHRIMESVLNERGGIFFLDAPGGTGKTFLTKLILAQVRINGKIALAMASSGIAATLLPGGKTAHSMLKIPLDLNVSETPLCDISRNSPKGKLLRETALIVWDECTMAHRKSVEAVDRTLQDIRQNRELMGGITMLLCGDFRQTLPVVTRGTRADEIAACLKNSVLWPHVTKLHLTTNMRAQTGANAETFSETLLAIGEDRLPKTDGQITLTNEVCKMAASLNDLILRVYGDPAQILHHRNDWLCDRAILAPKNDQVAFINHSLMERVEGEFVTYTSINRVVDQDDTTAYPIEFLNSLTASGLPAHELKLKIGTPIMLMRNISPPTLCNGTRLKVVALQRNVIEAEILSGCAVGERVFIPRIPLIPNNYPFSFKRIQFPVSVAFAMTINKAQGQTLRQAGVDLTTSCFSHGQLYVALSRVSSADDIFVYAPQNTTCNVVYEEALR